MRDFLSRAINTVWRSGLAIRDTGDELLTLREFERRGDEGFNVSPLATLDLKDLVMEIVDEACRKHGNEPNGAIYVAMCETIELLLFREGVCLPQIDWDRVETSFAYHDALRIRLTARAHFFSDYDRHMGILRHKIISIFSGLLNHLPEHLFQESYADGPTFSVALLDCVEELGVALDRLLVTYEDDDLVYASLGGEIRTSLIENILRASGIDPKARATTTRKIIIPSQSKESSPRELITKYLFDTPFADFFTTTVPFSIPERVRYEHCHILGGTGHGKTQLLQHLIFAELERARTERRSIVVIDSQGDLIRKLSRLKLFAPNIENTLFDRLCLIDPTDIEYPVSLNMFDLNRERISGYGKAEKEKILNGTVELYENFFGSLLGAELTQKQGVIFKYLARLMMEIPDANIHTLRDLMDDAEPFIPYMEKLHGSARYFYEREFFDRTFGQTKKQISKRLWGVLATPSFERMFAQPQNKVDMFELLNRGSVILINTAKDLLKQEGCELFGRFFMSMISQAAMERSVVPEHERTPTTIYVDEAQEYFDENVEVLLAQGRKYKIALAAGNQTLDQLSPGLRAAFMSNTGTKVVGGLSAKDASAFAADMHTTTEFLQSLKKRERVSEFALHVRHHTPQALRISVPLGFLEAQETLEDWEFEELLENSRRQYCVPWQEETTESKPFRRFARGEEPQRDVEVEDVVSPTASSKSKAQTDRVPLPTPPPTPRETIKPAVPVEERQEREIPPMGRGGRQHRYIQELIKGLAEELGYRAVIEEKVLDGDGFVDVSLTRGEERIACEISITTPVEHEFGNMAKCLAASYTAIWVISPEEKQLKAMRKRAAETLTEAQMQLLTFARTEDIPNLFAERGGTPVESTIRGYRVKVRRADASFDDTQTKRATVAEVLAKSAQSDGTTDS